jgi:hypothetical protein
MTRALAALVCALAAVVPTAAQAARPAGGRYYAPSRQLEAPGLVLRVSPSGGRVEAARVLVVCGRAFTRTIHFRAGSEGAVRGGRFAMAGRRRGLRYRFSGRFASPRHANVEYRVRFALPTLVGRPRQWCGTGKLRDEADLNGEPPYSGCRTQPAQNRLLTPTGRVYQQLKLVGRSSYQLYVYACSFDADRRVTIGPDADPNAIGTVRLAGQFVAYVRFYICAAGPCENSLQAIDVRDLRAGSLVRTASSFPGSFAFVEALELADNGAMAWMLSSVPNWGGTSEPVDRRLDVWASDSAGERLLDSGPELNTHSLRLSGSTLSWVNGGVLRSEELR